MHKSNSSEVDVVQDSKKVPSHVLFSETFTVGKYRRFFLGFFAIAGAM